MDFYLIDPDGPFLHFPVNPDKITLRVNKQYETVNIINLGEVDFPHGEKTREITFSSFFPLEYDSGYCRYTNIPHPQNAINQLLNWTENKKPVRLLVTTTGINTLVFLSTCNNFYAGGEPGDVYFDLTCRTWREVKIKAASGLTSQGSAVQEPITLKRSDTRSIPKTYFVRTGDTLYKIAKLELGNGAKWRDIYETNKAIIGANPAMIKPGQKLVMP